MTDTCKKLCNTMKMTTVMLYDRHIAMMLCKLIFLISLLNIPLNTWAFECETCNHSSCAIPESCAGGLVVDPCGCCKDCAKVVNESCGGQFGLHGRCDQGLYCAINPQHGSQITGEEDGICRGIPSPPVLACQGVQCDLVLEPQCPDDSLTTGGYVPPGECCSLPFHCECMPCLDTEPLCQPDQLRIRHKLGIGQPGQCCDVYICKDKNDICSDVQCEEDPFANMTCPPDSSPLSPLVTQNGCCVQHAGCMCNPPDQCDIPACLPGTRPQLRAPRTGLPGQCCDDVQCVSDTTVECLTSDGSWMVDGASWSLDACTECQCDRGLIRCDKRECGVLEHCGWISIPQGECCHKCMGCTKGNMTYENGAEWQQDPCVTCYCEEGQVYCRAELCQAADCAYPVRHVPGLCCPVCDERSSSVSDLPSGCPGLENCTLAPFCRLGLEEDEQGCYQCSCKDGVVIGIIPELCDLDCPLGFKINEDGVEVCECLSTMSSSTQSPSSEVSVNNSLPPSESPPRPGGGVSHGNVHCPSMSTCEKECAFGFRVSKEGCPKCKCNRCPPFLCQKKCIHGYSYNDNGCVLCKCRDNGTQLEVTSPAPDSEPDASHQGTCLTDDGRLWDDGQSWHDNCRLCFCHLGREMCTLITCPVPRCRHPLVLQGDCCASCPDEDIKNMPALATRCQSNGGKHIAEGETWMLDRCTLCICHNGEMLCEAERCPPLTCHSPTNMPDRCCPICLGEDQAPLFIPNKAPDSQCQVSQGMVFNSGDIWRVSACQSCMCRDGQIHCFSQTCPLLTKCNKTVMRKGQCCPQCIDENAAKICTLGTELYASGEVWLLNNCTWCVCRDGRILCLETQCSPLVDCAAVVVPTDSCCPICTNQSHPVTPGDTSDKYSTTDIVKGDGRDGRVPSFVVLLIVITVLVVLVIILLLAVLLLCWRKKKCKERQQYQHTKAVHAMFDREPCHINLNRRPKSVNLEYRGHNPLIGEVVRMDHRFDYSIPSEHKFPYYDETVGLLTAKSKLSDTESASIHQSCLIREDDRIQGGLIRDNNRIQSEKHLLQEKDKNNLNTLHKRSVEDNFNINCGSENTLTKSCNNSGNDLTGDTDKLSEFDNAACIGLSTCTVDQVGRQCSDSDRPQTSQEGLPHACNSDVISQAEDCNLLMDSPSTKRADVHNIHATPRQHHGMTDKHLRYSVNDDVWLRNSSQLSDHDKAPMADKYIRYSVGANCAHTGHNDDDDLLGIPSCDTNNYRKSL